MITHKIRGDFELNFPTSVLNCEMSSNYLFPKMHSEAFHVLLSCVPYYTYCMAEPSTGIKRHENTRYTFSPLTKICVKKRSLLSFYFENERLVVASASSPDLSTSYYKPSHYLVSFEWISSAAHSIHAIYCRTVFFSTCVQVCPA